MRRLILPVGLLGLTVLALALAAEQGSEERAAVRQAREALPGQTEPKSRPANNNKNTSKKKKVKQDKNTRVKIRKRLRKNSAKSSKAGKGDGGKKKFKKAKKVTKKKKTNGKGKGGKNKEDKRKKIKLIQKIKKKQANKDKKRGDKKTGGRQTSTSTGCQNITCLNTMLQVLKLDKDTVQNFIQQKKRIDARLTLASELFEKAGHKSAQYPYQAFP